MRREPWHQRLPATEHYQWFKNLVELHELTNSWLKEVQIEYSQHSMNRGFSKRVTENLWMLDSLAERKVEDFLDDTSPEDVLGRLEHAVWAAQAWTLTHFYLQTAEDSRKALDSVLEQLCWKAGRRCAESRWQTLLPTTSTTNSAGTTRTQLEAEHDKEGRMDLRDVVLAFRDSPCSGTSHREPFLIRRAVREKVELELLSCPHRMPYHEVAAVADRLCELHWHFLKGYAYALNPGTGAEAILKKPRCIHRWYLLQGNDSTAHA